MLVVQSVSKYYGDFLALDNISFEVKAGEIVAFLGPNGSGKTTTMRIISGFFTPSSGNVFIDGLNIFEESEIVKTFTGYLPENPPLYPELTVNEYLEFVAELKNVAEKGRKEKVNEVIELTGLNEKRNSLIASLSKGYKQRVGVAQSIVNDPKLLILDEPTVGLDPIQVIEIRNLIKNLAKDGKRTVILSTHILSEASEICKKAIIINRGKIIAVDEIDRLRSLTTNFSVEIHFKRNRDALFKKLINFEKVSKIEDVGDGFILNLSDDIREEIARLCIETDCGLIEMKKLKSSLEEVFVELVQ